MKGDVVMAYDCKYAKRHVQGMLHYMTCDILEEGNAKDNRCRCQGPCRTRNTVKHTEKARNCTIRLEYEHN